ncbi:hypothetical protein Jiend_07310 [Micromonospora endophytica]|nr:hypothetical protein Jiend_07310 [Micromonospora endophytica]
MTIETADDWRRPGPTAEQQRLDLYTGLAATALALISLTLVRSTGTFPLGPPPSGLEQILWTVAVPLPLIWRRRFPAATALVISAAFIGAQVRAVPSGNCRSGRCSPPSTRWGPGVRTAGCPGGCGSA